MNETPEQGGSPGTKGVNWAAIGLGLLVLVGWNIVRYSTRSENKDAPPSQASQLIRTDLKIGGRPLMIDYQKDGRVIADGQAMTKAEVKAQLPQWKESGRVVSVYSAAGKGAVHPDIDEIVMMLMQARLPVSPRQEPQQLPP